MRSKRALLVIAALSAAQLLLASPAQAAVTPRYTITDLGVLSSSQYATSGANAINNAGVVVGSTTVASGAQHAFKWAGGVMTDLGTNPGGGYSVANGINDAGQVAGTADRPTTSYGYPARWSAAGVIQDLGGPIQNMLGVGNGIDKLGRVVGGQRPADSEMFPNAMIYDVAGNSTLLGNPPESLDAAQAINSRGQVVGSPAFLWQNGVVTFLPGLPNGLGATSAKAINVRGQIVGAALVPGPYNEHAVLWQGSSIVDIGTVDGITHSVGNAINAAGVVVGTADPLCQPCVRPRAWIWRPGGTITALETLIPANSGWTLERANGINDHGQIVGAGWHNGLLRAYLLTPVFHAAINFQPASAPVQVGYAVDSGAVFGARTGGLSYGWRTDVSTFTRDRNAAGAPEQRYDTLIHSMHPTAANAWELAVPNGTYVVHVVAGDPSYTDSTHKIAVERVLAVNGTPTTAQPWLEGTVTVTVSDGRLTVGNATGAVNNKLNYVDVVSA